MNPISDFTKGSFSATIHLLNQPAVKAGVKNIAGTATFVFGLIEIYDICQIIRGCEISTETYPGYPKWVQVADKVIVVCAKISLILSAGVSRPGFFIISSVVGRVATTEQLERVFGPNTLFAINPWHPRHIVSIAAVVLALPAIVQSTCKGIHWAFFKVRQYHAAPVNDQVPRTWLTHKKIKVMNLFNTPTSRPVLHVGNQLGRRILCAGNDQVPRTWLTHKKIKVINLFNTLTSRPVLHIGNQLGRRILCAG